MNEFRWVSKVLSGPWVVTKNKALLSAVDYGQASMNEGKGGIITLRPYASIEERLSVNTTKRDQDGSLN